MAANAAQFNGARSALAEEAGAMVDAARAAAAAVAGELDVLEAATREQTALSSRRPQRKSPHPPSKKSRAHAPAACQAANNCSPPEPCG